MLHRIIAVLIRMIYDIMSPIIVEGIYPDYWEFRKVAQKKNSKFFTLINSRYCLSKGCYLALDTKIESNPILPHGLRGIFISKNATIGRNVTIFQQVTIGSNNIPGHKKNGSPKIGNNVYIGSGAKIIGNIKIGDNCRIGANAVVVDDMSSNTTAIQTKTRYINR